MNKSETVRVVKTDKLDQQKLRRIARRFNITPMNIRELQLGYAENIPAAAATQLESAGYVTRTATKLRTQQEKIAVSTVDETTPTITDEDETTVMIKPPDGVTSDPAEEDEEV